METDCFRKVEVAEVCRLQVFEPSKVLRQGVGLDTSVDNRDLRHSRSHFVPWNVRIARIPVIAFRIVMDKVKFPCLEARIHLGHPAVVEHVSHLGNPAALVEHQAMVVLGIYRERRAVLGIGDVHRLVEVLSRGTRADRTRHRVELVPDRRRDPRPRDQDHQDDDRDYQDVLYRRLPLRAAGKSTRYPPPKGISAANMCGSLRIALRLRESVARDVMHGTDMPQRQSVTRLVGKVPFGHLSN